LSNDGERPSNVDDTFNKVTKATNPAKVNVANTMLSDNDPAQHNGILESKRVHVDCNNVDCDDALIDVLIAPSVNLTVIEMATKKLADVDPHESTSKRENNDPVCVIVVSDTMKVDVATKRSR
jgi:hypothetical protein